MMCGLVWKLCCYRDLFNIIICGVLGVLFDGWSIWFSKGLILSRGIIEVVMWLFI